MKVDVMTLKQIINDSSISPALVIGNGINRFNSVGDIENNSWDSMLLSLWKLHSSASNHMFQPKGISLTEFYDVLDLTKQSSAINLQDEFCKLMSTWAPKEHHKKITLWAQENSVPVLTTNFENTLSCHITDKITHFNSKKFTDYYPWNSYFSDKKIMNPSKEFAIWHINGMQQYKRSVRLGLSHYMGSVERARGLLHKGNESRLFSGKNIDEWAGYQSWLHVIFNNDLIFIGLGLETTEVFLRWLLIERAKYFKQFPQRKRKAYFIHADSKEIPIGQKLFLNSVGIDIVQEHSYEDLYQSPW